MAKAEFVFFEQTKHDRKDNVLVLGAVAQKKCKHEFRNRSVVQSGWKKVCRWCGKSSR